MPVGASKSLTSSDVLDIVDSPRNMEMSKCEIVFKDRRREMSEASGRPAQCFSIERTVDAHVEVYQSLLRQMSRT